MNLSRKNEEGWPSECSCRRNRGREIVYILGRYTRYALLRKSSEMRCLLTAAIADHHYDFIEQVGVSGEYWLAAWCATI